MLSLLRREWTLFSAWLRRIDRQAAFVLVACVVIVLVQLLYGSRRFFLTHLGPHVPFEHRDLVAWGWWFGMQGMLGFILPVLALVFLFKRRPSEIGLGLGDWRLAGLVALLYVPIVTLGTWVLSDGAAFQAQYPHYRGAAFDWGQFLIYEALFLFYWIGWEYLWRGFVLFGTAPAFGSMAVFVQMVPFAILHADKPAAEAFLSILGGVLLGALVWRCRSFWIAVPIHAFQMMILDFWCTLRVRTGVSGTGPGALVEIFRAL
jgi:uncharacterized protein